MAKCTLEFGRKNPLRKALTKQISNLKKLCEVSPFTLQIVNEPVSVQLHLCFCQSVWFARPFPGFLYGFSHVLYLRLVLCTSCVVSCTFVSNHIFFCVLCKALFTVSYGFLCITTLYTVGCRSSFCPEFTKSF